MLDAAPPQRPPPRRRSPSFAPTALRTSAAKIGIVRRGGKARHGDCAAAVRSRTGRSLANRTIPERQLSQLPQSSPRSSPKYSRIRPPPAGRGLREAHHRFQALAVVELALLVLLQNALQIDRLQVAHLHQRAALPLHRACSDQLRDDHLDPLLA